MKTNFIKTGLLFIMLAVATAIIIAACNKKFLDQDTTGVLTEEQAQSRKGAQQFLIAAYASLKGIGWEGSGSNWVYGSICGGDANKGSDGGDQADVNPIQQYAHLPTNRYFNVKWQAVYDGISRANATIRIATKLTSLDITDAEKKQILAEARFLRGFYHFEAKKMWNKIPYVDETITFQANNFKLANSEDWIKIMEDLDFARKNLPATISSIGRINKWGADAYYAKGLLYQKKYAEARPIFADIIANGVTTGGIKYNLAPSFDDIFNADRENVNAVRAESVFAYEASVNDGSNGANANFDNVLNFPYNGGPGGCCGFFQPSFELANSFRTSAGLPLPNGTYNSAANQLKTDQGIESNQAFTVDPATVDPRLDWTVGRRGLPYLDWGNHPGKSWIRDQGNGGPYSPKKNVYYQSQEKKLTDGTSWAKGLVATNYKFMRFADVLLMAAECEVESGGNLETARSYVNTVRLRAKNSNLVGSATLYNVNIYPTIWTDPIAARDAVRFERKLELAMEGHRFFDLVRWGIAATSINSFLAYEKTKLAGTYGAATFTAGKNEYFPIPQRQIDLHKEGGVSKLVQNPGY